MDRSNGHELEWNGTIEKDGSDFVLLPAGVYPFKVVSFERARFKGSAKLPECNQAILTIEVDGGNGEVSTIQHSLFLHTVTEGLLCQFFTAIGSRKHGESIVMDWNQVPGATGYCRVIVEDWAARDGSTKQSNKIKSFLPPEKWPTATNTAPAAGQPETAPAAGDEEPLPF